MHQIGAQETINIDSRVYIDVFFLFQAENSCNSIFILHIYANNSIMSGRNDPGMGSRLRDRFKVA
jgi:hypothetical protein